MNKEKLYESIMASVTKELKKVLNEGENMNQYSAEFNELVKKVKNGNYNPVKPEDDAQIIFSEFVPASGASDVVAGEIMRAIMRIAYRYYNDGDVAGDGYGKETVNPAVRYLNIQSKNDKSKYRKIVERFMDMVYDGFDGGDDEYEYLISVLFTEGIKYIILNNLYEIGNHDDMWDFRNPKEDVDDSWKNDEYDDQENDEDDGWYEDDRYDRY